MIGGAAFGIASVIAAFSTTPEMLIASRALLGVAGATLSPSILALITNMFRDDAQRGFAISVWLACFMGGMTVGPLVGGVMLEHFWWGAAFLLGVPVMLLLLVTAPFLLPEYKAPQAGRIDLLSVVLSLLTILPVIYGLKEVAKHGLETVFVDVGLDADGQLVPLGGRLKTVRFSFNLPSAKAPDSAEDECVPRHFFTRFKFLANVPV